MTRQLIALAALGFVSTACAGLPSDQYPEPPLSPMQDPRAHYQYQPVLMPTPQPTVHTPQHANSLWQAGARSFFDDPRAQEIGDILTVMIDISDNASVSNSTEATRSATEDAELDSFFGFDGLVGETLGAALPAGFTPSGSLDLASNSRSIGDGTIDRSETINLTAAAIVTDVLPNNNLVISGRQEVRVNAEKRVLFITGIVRPEDITAANTIKSSQIAEARISYGGQGVISAAQNPRYGQRLVGRVTPF
jgi:flagellar L-ring protein precursor FlgH